jgi:cadmium resistance protein CadD (predicted permease)
MRNLLLFAHVVTAIVLIGPTTLATSVFARAAEEGDRGAMAAGHRTSRAYGTASVVVAGIGLAMAARNNVLDQLWISSALGLFAVALGLLFAVHLPAQRRAMGDDGADPALLGRLRASAGGYALTWVAIVWLMVAKPA